LRLPDRLELAWGALACACVTAMVAYPSWETIPFHVIWISLTLLYGFRVWPVLQTAAVLGAVALSTGISIMVDAFEGIQLWGELFEVPLMSAMFLAMVWHARRRQAALAATHALAEERATLLEQEERLVHNVGHELRTPVTIARGHLELLDRRLGSRREVAVALDELARIEHVVERVLLLARLERPDLLSATQVALVPFLEDIFIRWSEVAPRAWRLGAIVDASVTADETWLRAALDALLENAVQYTKDWDGIELAARGESDSVVITVSDEGIGIAPDVSDGIFERFARGESARSVNPRGSGLGLAIVAATARAHGGACTVASVEGVGSTFELSLPLPQALHADLEQAAGPRYEMRRSEAATSAASNG